MSRSALLALLLAATASVPASAESILGTWRLSNGERVTYAPCGPAYCSTVDSGRYKGQSVGRMEGAGPDYTGTVTDPRDNKTYEGRASVEGNTLVLTGCVARVFCRSQTWTR